MKCTKSEIIFLLPTFEFEFLEFDRNLNQKTIILLIVFDNVYILKGPSIGG